MPKSEPGGRYLLCRALGISYHQLSREEQAAASAQVRILSVGPLIIQKSKVFVDSLRDRQRVNYDLEDVISEVVAELLLKDHLFDPAISPYLAFCKVLIEHLFTAIRDVSSTVHSPTNSGNILSNFEVASQEVGEIEAHFFDLPCGGRPTQRRAATAEKIKNSRHEFGDLESHPFECSEQPEDDVSREEESRLARDAVVRGLCALTPGEASALGSRYGLYGQTEVSVDEIARRRGCSRSEAAKLLKAARLKFKARLMEIGHPCCSE